MTLTQLVDLGVVLVGLVVAILLAVFLGLGMKQHPTQQAAWAALRKTSRRWLGGASLGIPNLEASNVELKGSSAGRPGGPFHHQLILRKDRVAGIAGFPGARTAPDLCDAVVWQAPVSDLALD